jgi:hypothetical protein
MGWNDRLPEDPYWPEQNSDREAYENWLAYLESQLDEAEHAAGLTSQNVDPADLARRTSIYENENNEDSRQPAHHQEEQRDRRADTATDSQDIQGKQEVS